MSRKQKFFFGWLYLVLTVAQGFFCAQVVMGVNEKQPDFLRGVVASFDAAAGLIFLALAIRYFAASIKENNA